MISATWENPAQDSDRMAAARAFGAAVLPLSTGRSYVNTLADDGTNPVRAAYGESTYERLVSLKDRYDPDNVFHLNQNVRPSGR